MQNISTVLNVLEKGKEALREEKEMYGSSKIPRVLIRCENCGKEDWVEVDILIGNPRIGQFIQNGCMKCGRRARVVDKEKF